MSEVAKTFGITIKRSMSRRTVSRCVLEGGIAAKLQLGYEMAHAQSMTLSGDSTSNRKINYDSRHIALRVPDYRAGELTSNTSSTPAVRLLGVDSLVDHSSKTSVDGWKGKFKEITDLLAESPLGQRMPTLTTHDVVKIIKGMNGDHASNEKNTADRIKDWKKETMLLEMGGKELEKKTPCDLVFYLWTWSQKAIQEAGGLGAWNALSATERAERETALMAEIKLALGKAAYDKLSAEEKREMDLFIWAGCCMHKDQNSFKGGNAAMMAWWEETGHTPPITLANKQNAAILKRILDPATTSDGPLTDDEIAALESSTCGGVKAVALAAAIFNHKDDKRGLGDSHVYHFEDVHGNKLRRFPDANNTRFGSFGEGAAELLAHLEEYLEFLLLVKNKKKTPGWTNIELNVYRALRDISTLTELAGMALYSQAVTHPYMRVVRGPGTENVNVLDLKIFHVNVRNFIQGIIDEPTLLVSPDASPKTASLDGKDWERPDVIGAIQKLMPTLPHLQEVTVAFFKGALATWIRVTAEFAPGGLIDTASSDELAKAWMPTTNDPNEGRLGGFRVEVRDTPTLTMVQYNSKSMHERNDTQAFIEAILTIAADHLFLMRKAREIDASGLEKKRRREQVEFDLKVARIQKKKDAAKKKQEIEDLQQLLSVQILLEDEVELKTVKVLDQQLDLLQKFGKDTDIPKLKKDRGNKATKQTILRKALRSYHKRQAGGGASVEASIRARLQELEEERPENDAPCQEWDEEEEIEMEE